MPKISTVLDQIDLGAIALPQFQRGYVWRRPQIRRLFRSLYRRHPIGGLLVWETVAETANTRGEGSVSTGSIKLLLDGQQRVTSIYGVVRGRPPQFFDRDGKVFRGLHFHLENEEFEFFSPKMKDDPLWIDVTWVMQTADYLDTITNEPAFAPFLSSYVTRLNQLKTVLERELHMESITGENRSPDEVVEIFNQVNSGGTKLSKGDLAMAKISADWPHARFEMRRKIASWRKDGYEFKLDWLLRCVNVVLTGEAKFSHLHDVGANRFKDGLKRANKYIEILLSLIQSRLGLDHQRALLPVSAFPVMVRYIDQRHGKLNAREQNKLLYWYVHAGMWGRYSGAIETALNQDIDKLDRGSLDNLIEGLRQFRGSLEVKPEQFKSWSKGARFYPILYMLTYRASAKDFCFGTNLVTAAFGSMKHLELHHIFPKSRLYAYGYDKTAVNALANFCFLTADCNRRISDRLPREYLPEIRTNQPGALESQWIPMDEKLWEIEHYGHFLNARRELLAKETNLQLEKLLADHTKPEKPHSENNFPSVVAQSQRVQAPGGFANDAEEQRIKELNDWVQGHGLKRGHECFEHVDPKTGDSLAILDLAWPSGLQSELTTPVAILLDEPSRVLELANRAGYQYFTSIEQFKDYVRSGFLV